MVRLIALLGNKGSIYSKTRHNVAWIFQQEWERYWNSLSGWQSKFHAEWKRITWKNTHFIVVKPMTFMNLSGTSIADASNYFDISPEQILVVHDDIELPYGSIRLQMGGPLAGHNGLRSIRQMIKTDQFLRLRIGVGRPVHHDVASYVLSRFNPDEEVLLSTLADKSRQLVEQFIDSNFSTSHLPYSVQF